LDKHVKAALEGLASYGVVFMQLTPGTKHTTRTWDYFEALHEKQGGSRMDLAEKWLKEGYGVGYLPRKRLGVVDADAPDTVQRILDFEVDEIYVYFPKVWTPSGGLHAIFEHAPGIDMSRLKNHVCHPEEEGVRIPWDFKLGERTMLVAPGTVTPKGTYTPGPWITPPRIDVRFLAPGLNIYRETTPFLRDTRLLRERIMGAMTYLRLYAPICIEGKGARQVLWKVASHVVAYYDLGPSLAFHLMVESKGGHKAWNERCLHADGSTYPWSWDELATVLEQAVDAVPSYGVLLYKESLKRQHAVHSAAEFMDLLTFLPQPVGDIWITPESLYRAFLEYFDVDSKNYDKKELGCELSKAMDAGRLPFVLRDRINSAGRIYRGVDANTLKVAIAAYEAHWKPYLTAS
jgi:hypothetical protein